MARRLKPQPGVNLLPKAKSRWCVRGYQDPDTKSLQVYSPTPQTESLMLFVQAALNLRVRVCIADLEQAFLQSDPLVREAVDICVEPCVGTHVSACPLLQLVVPVYGMDDEPLALRRTITNFLATEKFQMSLLVVSPPREGLPGGDDPLGRQRRHDVRSSRQP